VWPDADQTAELLAGAQAGDQSAVNQLLDRHRSAVHRMIGLRLDQKIQRRVDVSDVVQEVFIEASRRLPEYLRNPAMPFHLWLRHIAQDRIIDAHRRHRGSAKRSVDRERPLFVRGADDRSTFELAAQLCDPERTPASAAAQREMAQHVEAALAQLDDQDCEVIVMRHYEHLSNQEVATALQLSEPAAGMRYLRAIRRLRSLLSAGSLGDE
jgi:RNA polymerase sigma-70 factor (ECF subfamily)